jgi:hypothetical protein
VSRIRTDSLFDSDLEAQMSSRSKFMNQWRGRLLELLIVRNAVQARWAKKERR